jgi:NAD(P)-dependent dehydrogenase (short-subunit alcohol dehydrogenase family)
VEIEDTVALVTGANRGLGKAFTEALLERGAAKVYATARDPESVAATDSRVIRLPLDVTNRSQIDAVAEVCGDVSLLINNAGTLHRGALLDDGSVEGMRADLETNLFAPLAMARAFAPTLAGNGGGAIVNMLSVLSFISLPDAGGYGASKAGAWSMTNGLRVELNSLGTHIVAIHCGYIDTDMAASIDAPKLAPAVVANAALDAVRDGVPEVLADDLTRAVKQGLPRDPFEIYDLARAS